MSDNLIQVYTVYIEAPASKVWDAITTSEHTNRWGYGGDTEYDLTPGGAYRNHTTEAMKAMGLGDVAVSGTVVSVEVGRRLELTWQPAWYPDAAPTVLTWELTEFAGPLTRVVLTHDLTAHPALADEVAGGGEPAQGAGGWPWTLASLKTLVETGRPMVGSGS
ncbi:MAG: SRPBCC domain-containing protein [Propionibacteriaceae bacterium]|nr:SRPBCC domain-containing protein [Propionibacteriaceae bacterium]